MSHNAYYATPCLAYLCGILAMAYNRALSIPYIVVNERILCTYAACFEQAADWAILRALKTLSLAYFS